MAIDDTDGADRTGYFNATTATLQAENDERLFSVSTEEYVSKSTLQIINDMQTTDIFVIHTHGIKEGFKIGPGTFIEKSSFELIDLSNLELVILLTCFTADDYDVEHINNETPVNIVEQLVLSDAETVLGFEGSTVVGDCDRFIGFLMEKMVVEGKTISEAISELNCVNYHDTSFKDRIVIAGNPNKTIR